MTLKLVGDATFDVPETPICREADRSGAPCRYAGICHEVRQKQQDSQALRGEQCWAFQQYIAKGLPGTTA